MLKHLFISMALAFYVSYAGLALAQELTILSVEEPPSSYTSPSNLPSGFSVDIVREIQRRINDTTPIKIVPEARALLTASEKPNVLLFAFSRTPEREDNFHWITLLLRKPWVLYSSANTDFTINNLNDAKKLPHIGVVIGDIREEYLLNHGFTNLSHAIDHKQNINMLALNRIQLLFYEPLGMAYLCKELGIPLTDFDQRFRATSSDVYLMMSKKGTNQNLVRQWQKASKQMKQDGAFEKIADQWSLRISQETGMNYGYKDGALDLLD